MFLSEKIKELREQKRLSRSELGEITGTSNTHIRYLEQGKRKDPQLTTILKLAKAFELTVDGLLQDTEFDLDKM